MGQEDDTYDDKKMRDACLNPWLPKATGIQRMRGKKVKYLRTVMARLEGSRGGSPVKAMILTLRKNASVSSRHMPAAMSSKPAKAGHVRSSGGGRKFRAAQALQVTSEAQSSTQCCAANS